MDASELVAYWSRIGSGNVHPDDREFIDARFFCLDQLPVPWAGPLKSAKVFTLLLNPVYTDEDKKYELANSALREAIRANFSGHVPCYSFQEIFSDYHGHKWARETYGSDVVERYSDSICQVNLVPYHSATGDVAKRISTKLPTSIAAQRFVQQNLIPRALAGEIGLVVARSSRYWGISTADESHNIVVYQGWENRRARQTENTRGGQLIRRLLFSPSIGVEEVLPVTALGGNSQAEQNAVKKYSTEFSKGSTATASWSQASNVRKLTPQAGPSFKMKSTDLVTWIVGTRVEASGVQKSSKRYAWLKAMQSVESFSAAKRVQVICEGKRIDDIGAAHVRWAVDNKFLTVTEHSR